MEKRKKVKVPIYCDGKYCSAKCYFFEGIGCCYLGDNLPHLDKDDNFYLRTAYCLENEVK